MPGTSAFGRNGVSHWWTLVTFACAAALLAAGGCSPAALRPIDNVVIITLDTTRADRLPAYGYPDLETPALDRLAREGVVFEQATSSVPLTLPAHCTLFTGLLPQHHHVRDNVDPALADSETTLAEILKARGLRTAAFVGSLVVGPGRGLAQGFERYSAPSRSEVVEQYRRSGDVVVDEAVQWLDHQGDSRFFTWIHLYDAHAPYSLPEPYRTMYEDAPYLGALAFLDAQVARVVDALERRHLLDRTLLVVASDHGESLGDHGEDGHGVFVYQSTLHVPLIVRLPGLAPRRVSDVTRLTDVMPTVLDALHVPVPQIDGISLVPLMTGRAARLDLEAYSESEYPARFGWSPLRALREGRFKFVAAPRPELYDLDADPGEQHNLVSERSALTSSLSKRIAALAEAGSSQSSSGAAIDAESAERLAALGYVGRVGNDDARAAHSAAIDPKDCIGRYNDIVRARGASPLAPSEPVEITLCQ